MARSRLSCCLVIKNEEKLIIHNLNELYNVADEVVIVDTGSTDKTHALVEDWIKKNKVSHVVKFLKVGNKFHDEDGDFHFGNAKTYAMSQATGDFVFWLDAADIITDPKEVKKLFLKITDKYKDVYFTLPTSLSKTVSYPRVRIAPRIGTSMVGRVHEYMQVPPNLKKLHIPVNINNQKNADGLDRNLRLLLKDWKTNESARNAFYLANTYREKNDLENALIWFKKRVYQFEWREEFREEHFKSMECLAYIYETMIRKKKAQNADLLDIAEEMIAFEPERFEGYYYKAKYHMNKSEWQPALDMLNKYKICKVPKEVKLWLDQRIYNIRGFLTDIEKCKTAIKYKDVLVPKEISDYVSPLDPRTMGAGSVEIGKTTYFHGDQQYS